MDLMIVPHGLVSLAVRDVERQLRPLVGLAVSEDLTWGDILGVSLLTGVGFTVSLLVGELAFGVGSARDDHVKVAILVGSLLAALLASMVLIRRNAAYRRIEELEAADSDEAVRA